MPVEFLTSPSAQSRPVHLAGSDTRQWSDLPDAARAWLQAVGFDGKAGKLVLLPGSDGSISGAVLGTGGETGARAAMLAGACGRDLPEGDWHFAGPVPAPDIAATALVLGAYRFTRYGGKPGATLRFALPEGCDRQRVEAVAAGVTLARDLINTPANDMGPAAIEHAVRTLAGRHGARVEVTTGDALLGAGLPMIHAVGRAAAEAPRLIDLVWGRDDAPRVTLVGKGVAFDTGGLDIKPSSAMLLMKKDMGGAANVLGLAEMIMATRLDLRLRVLVPAVENSISAASFRPGDVLASRKGMTVEIGNTDAEGRLILADALALADEEQPELLIDMSTLTGAARVALGPELPPFFTHDEALAGELAATAEAEADPCWRLPLWKPYAEGLKSRIADIGNVTSDGFAGAITAALFLERFVDKARSWMHFDIYGWNPKARPHAPVGGEAQCIRALFALLNARYGR